MRRLSQWFDDPDTVIGFAKVLNDAELFEWNGDVIRYFEKPYLRDREYRLYRELGSPEKGTGGWNEWLSRIED